MSSCSKRVPVSGQVLLGVRGVGAALETGGPQATSLAQLRLLVPATRAYEDVCLQVTSRDGRYRAQNTFRLPAGRSRASVRVVYPTQHAAIFAEAGTQTIAFLARPGPCERQDEQRSLVVVLAASEVAEIGPISIFVNAGRDDAFVTARDGMGKDQSERCARIREGARTAFDTECRIPPPTSAVDVTAVVDIMRRGRLVRSEEIVLSLAP